MSLPAPRRLCPRCSPPFSHAGWLVTRPSRGEPNRRPRLSGVRGKRAEPAEGTLCLWTAASWMCAPVGGEVPGSVDGREACGHSGTGRLDTTRAVHATLAPLR